MHDSILGPWRDVSLIILIIPAVIFTLIPGAIYFFAIKGVRWVNRSIRQPLLTARVWTLRAQYETQRAARVVAEVPIAAESFGTRAKTTVRGLAEFFGVEF